MSLTRSFPLLSWSVLLASGLFVSVAGQQPDTPAAVGNQVLVQFSADSTSAERAAARGRIRAAREEVVVAAGRRDDGKGDLELLRLPPGLAVAAAIRGLTGDAAVEFAEPNWIYQHGATATDPYFTNGSLWGMYGDASSPANQFGSQAAEAWAAGNTGQGAVYVGIIDEGVMRTHQDLTVNVFINPFDPVDGIDNDGNGYVDDIHGWDFDGNNNSTYDGTQDDHGTHVAGTIGAVGGNAIGVAGMNWQVTMIPAKFLGRRGGTTANAIKAVDYFTDLKTRHGFNIVATNNSWGGGGFSQGLLDAINRGGNANILFVAAAGNGGSDGVGDNNDTTASYPSNYQCTANGTYDCVIAVAAITSAGAKSGFSNYGAATVDIGAPGSGIYSTLPGKGNSSTYGSYSGTSMATPHVTGAAALFAARNPGATAAQIRSAILGSAIPTTSLANRTVTGGRLNVGGF
ncbi:MAG: S8 family peptidase [Acidobacteriota bacterium]|nr:S8 family peptidase [Acidobacteriota bacterium]